MDARLYDDVREFTDRIKDTPEYREYQEKKKIIEGYPELKEKAEEIKKKNLEINSSFEDGRDTLEDLKKFADEYQDVFMEPVINDYLAAESAFCRMMREILTMTMERIDL